MRKKREEEKEGTALKWSKWGSNYNYFMSAFPVDCKHERGQLLSC